MRLLIGTSLLALAAPAYADGNDHFNAGIDAERPGFGSSVNTSSTASDVDHEGGALTDSDRQMIASLVGSAWGVLVSIENNRAKFQDGNRTYFRDLPNPPASKPRPAVHTQVPAPAPAPSVDMGTISAPPLELAAWTPEPLQPSAALPEMSPPTAQLSLPAPSVPPRTGYADVEPTIRARIPVDTRLPGVRLRRKGEAEVAAGLNLAVGFGIGAAFGYFPGGGKVHRPGTVLGAVENGALVALAYEHRRRRNGGRTPFDADVRAALNMDDAEVRALTRDIEKNMTPHQAEQFAQAFAKERRAYNRREREATRHDMGRHEK